MYNSVHSQRYGKAKGMKVKHLVQLVALTVLFTWFLYQLNSSHKAKVLSRHAAAESEELVDDELLISDDHFRVGDDELHIGQTVAQEEFIDKKSVLKSRKMLPVVDTTELDQFITEMERVDEAIRAERVEDLGLLDDLGRSDVDERAAAAKRAAEEESDAESKREVIRQRAARDGIGMVARQTPPVPYRRGEVRGGGVVADIATGEKEKELDGKLPESNFTATTVEEEIYSSRDTTVKRFDGSEEEKTPTDPTMVTADVDQGAPDKDNTKPAGGGGSGSNQVRQISQDRRKKNLSKPDGSAAQERLDGGDDRTNPLSGVGTREDISRATDAHEHRVRNGEVSSSSADVKKKDNSRKPSVVMDEMDSGFPPEARDEPGEAPIPLQSGADGEAVQRADEARHYSTAVASHGDGHDEKGYGSRDSPPLEGAIAEVVVSGVSRQGQSDIAEVVSVAEQNETDGA